MFYIEKLPAQCIIRETTKGYAAVAIGKHAQYNALLTAAGAHAIPHLAAPRDEVFSMLDAIGVIEIEEQLALGRLPNEVALAYDIPVLHFRAWLRERVPEDRMDEIRAAAAESLQVKSVMVLSAELKSPAEASQAKALSERMARQSESLDPKAWSAAHVAPDRSMPPIHISFMAPEGVDSARHVVVSHEDVEPQGSPRGSYARTIDPDEAQRTETSSSAAIPQFPPAPDITAPVPARRRSAAF